MSFSDSDEGAWQRLPFSLTIADLDQDDQPLVFVNSAFEQMTGYAARAVLGRNCRFLQGEKTDPAAVDRLRQAIAAREELEETIYNYRASGEGFWNRLIVGPLAEEGGECRYFVGIQYDAGPETEPQQNTDIEQQLSEVQHRVKNHLSMIVGMIRIHARQAPNAEQAFDTLSRRVEALQLLYQEMDHAGAASATDKVIPLGAYLSRIAAALNHLDGRRGIKVNFQADTLDVPVETAARTGLVVSEILTNSLQHAFEDRRAGVISVRVRVLSGEMLRISMEDDGCGLPTDCKWPEEGNLGARIVRQLVAGLGGTIIVQRGQVGTIVNLDIPLDQQVQHIEDERADAQR